MMQELEQANTAIVVSDFHFKDDRFINPEFESWQRAMFKESISKIEKHIIDKDPDIVLLLGDLFEKPPQGTSMELFHELVVALGDKPAIMIDGNHEVLSSQNRKRYYNYTMKEFMRKNFGISVLDWREVGELLFASHKHIDRLERLKKPYKIVFSHFRSGLGEMVYDEIDTTVLQHKSDLVVLGDIHQRLSYDNIVYAGSPIDTEFAKNNEQDINTPSVLWLDLKSLEWEWLGTLKHTFRKKRETFNSAYDFLSGVDELKQDALDNNHFYKIVVRDKKLKLRKVIPSEYKDWALVEKEQSDLVEDSHDRKVIEDIKQNLDKNSVSDSLLEFLEKSCEEDLLEDMRSLYHSYERGVRND